jgi:hypothetical protein
MTIDLYNLNGEGVKFKYKISIILLDQIENFDPINLSKDYTGWVQGRFLRARGVFLFSFLDKPAWGADP